MQFQIYKIEKHLLGVNEMTYMPTFQIKSGFSQFEALNLISKFENCQEIQIS